MNANSLRTADTRVYPVKPSNQIKTVTKRENGDLAVELNSGLRYVIAKEDELFQAFAVYTMLAHYTS